VKVREQLTGTTGRADTSGISNLSFSAGKSSVTDGSGLSRTARQSGQSRQPGGTNAASHTCITLRTLEAIPTFLPGDSLEAL